MSFIRTTYHTHIRRVMIAIAICAGPATGQGVPPDESWRTLETKHFRISFPKHLEDLGRRAADRAEWAYARLSEEFLEGPRGTIDLVVSDHVDVSNGFATVWPSNRIFIYARPPVDDFGLAYFDDWLEHVIVHEVTHIFHIDRLGRYSLRQAFGRVPLPVVSFPAYSLPRWVHEGIATWYESALTGAGRVEGTFHDMVLRTAALEGRFESMGQAGGNSPQWPGGTRVYAYGSLFFDHLIEQYGRDRMAAFVKAVEGQWIPYRLNAAGRRAFGVTLSSAWKAWAQTRLASAATLDRELGALGAITEPETLTRGARYARHPKISPDGASLVYIRSDGRSDVQLVSADPNGGGASTIALTSGGAFSFAPNGDIVFAAIDFADRYRQFSDLYQVAPGRAVQRVTINARLTAPSVTPDGWAVAIVEGRGTNGLARVDLRDGRIEMLVPPSMEVHWAYPAVSPDGRYIAATRWTGGWHDIVILDAKGRRVCEVTRDRALDFAPSWSADGQWLVWSSDRTGIPNVLAAKVDQGTTASPVMLTNVRTGAAFPSVDPSGQWLYFSGYHVNGWEVERVPFNPTAAPHAPQPRDESREIAIADRPNVRVKGPARAYSPLPTLRPYYWWLEVTEPIAITLPRSREDKPTRVEVLGYAIDAQTSGMDLVSRHAYAARARVFLPGPSGRRAAGSLSYQYRGLGNPTLGVSLLQNWGKDGARIQRGSAARDTFFVLERARRVAVSITLTRPKIRSNLSLALSGGLVREDREVLDRALQLTDRFQLDRPSNTLGELSIRFSASTARSHAFQMGRATGASFSVRARHREDLNAPTGESARDRSVDSVIGVFRTYARLPGRQFAVPVLALRASAGAARGPGSGTDYFDIGGASGNTAQLSFPVRGYQTTTRSGRRAWAASVEYRVPIALINRGLGSWPLHADRLFGSLFMDAADAWGNDAPQTRSRPLLSAGAEITADTAALYLFPIRLRIGAARRFTAPRGFGYYVRLGMSF